MSSVSTTVSALVSQLRLNDPSVSAEVGSPERNALEAFAEVMSQVQVNLNVINSQHDLQAMTGSALDSYLGNFGFGRQQATSAVGTATFLRSSAASTTQLIPRGTQLAASTGNPSLPNLVFVTTQSGTIGINGTTVDIPIQCTTSGSVGNLPANSISGFAGLRAITGVTSVTNANPTTGGQDADDDTSLKTRFSNTIFRNESGTYDQYLALAVSAAGVTKANVVGAISRWQEYIQIPTVTDAGQVADYDTAGTTYPQKKTTAASLNTNAQHIYNQQFYLTDSTLDPQTATFFRSYVDFVFNQQAVDPTSTTRATITGITAPNYTILATSSSNPAGLLPGTIVLSEYAYLSKNSRNNYALGILNCTDVFINGSNPANATSMESIPDSTLALQTSPANSWRYQNPGTAINFKRSLDGSACTVGNYLQSLYYQPLVSAPNSITAGASTYYLANFQYTGQAYSFLLDKTTVPTSGTYFNQLSGSGTSTDPYIFSFRAHYAQAYETNTVYGSLRARDGIEWFIAGPTTNAALPGQTAADAGDTYSGVAINGAVVATSYEADYQYDKNISDLQAVMESSKQTTSDILVHKAKPRYFRANLTIMYSNGYNQGTVNDSITASLASFFSGLYFSNAIQLSDILQAVHNTAGVDNVRFTTGTGIHPIEEVTVSGVSFSTALYWDADFLLQDNELAFSPNTNAVTIVPRAASNFSN